ncbi:MAG: glycosyltransferase family 4 protein, partial [bacterium]
AKRLDAGSPRNFQYAVCWSAAPRSTQVEVRPRSRLKLLVLSPVVPDAPSDGDRLRLYHWLEYLEPRHELHLACFADLRRHSDFQQGGLLGRLARVVRVPRSRWGRRLAAAARLGSTLPTSVASEADGRMGKAVDALLSDSTHPFDAVLGYRLKMAPYALRFRGPRFLDYTDSMTRYTERLAAERAFQGTWRTRVNAWSLRIQARRLAAYEAWCAGHFDAGFFNAAGDRDAVAAMNPSTSEALHVAANGVDWKFFAPPRSGRPACDPRGLLFVGNLAYAPNADAVVWFARSVLPLVRAQVPNAHLTVVGGGGERLRRAFQGLPGLRFTGFIQDTRPLLWGSALSVCPVRTGAGRQNKLLEAFAAGLPAVATPLAAEGAEARNGTHLLVAGNAGAFSGAVLRLLRDPALGRRLAKRACALARESYDWTANAKSMETAMLAGARRCPW